MADSQRLLPDGHLAVAKGHFLLGLAPGDHEAKRAAEELATASELMVGQQDVDGLVGMGGCS